MSEPSQEPKSILKRVLRRVSQRLGTKVWYEQYPTFTSALLVLKAEGYDKPVYLSLEDVEVVGRRPNLADEKAEQIAASFRSGMRK